ncbi:MAG: zinc ribbon domain-containing protein [Chloroflexota bacterium]
MPVYEYRCPTCRRRTSAFFLTYAEVHAPACPRCGQSMQKLVSLFSTVKSEEARADELGDPSTFGDLDEDDPRSVARWARRMGKELGEDLGPEFDEMVDAVERGEDPAGFDGGPEGEGMMDGVGDMGGLDE